VRKPKEFPMSGEQRQSSLSVTDNRTGRTYEIPIKDGAIPAMALRDIKVDEDDFGLLSYDPAFMNTASCRSAITFIDGEQGILRYRGYPIQELAERVSFLEVAWLLVSGDLPDQGSWPTGPTRSTTTPSSRRTSRSSSTASTTTPTRWASWSARWGRCRPSTPTPSRSTTRRSGAARWSG
jgi:hypothetical protein